MTIRRDWVVDVDACRKDLAQCVYVATTRCSRKPRNLLIFLRGHTAVLTLSLWQLTHPMLVLESTDVNKEWTGRALRCWTSTAIVPQAVWCSNKSFGRRRVVRYELAASKTLAIDGFYARVLAAP